MIVFAWAFVLHIWYLAEISSKKAESVRRARTPKGFDSLPVIESELKYKQLQLLAERQRNMEYNIKQQVE